MACEKEGGATAVYLDGVFLLNGIADYLVLLLTARLAGIPLRRRRYFAAALLGAIYGTVIFLPGGGILAALPAKLAAGFLLALIAFGWERKLLRLVLLMWTVACGLAGCVLALAGGSLAVSGENSEGRFWVLALSAAAFWALTVVFRSAAGRGVKGILLPVRVCLCGRIVELTALWDSGNGLQVGGEPVLVTAPEVLRPLFSPNLCSVLTEEALQHPVETVEHLANTEPMLFPRLLPFCAVGVPKGMLTVVRTDWIEICGVRRERAYAALSPTPLGTGYTALWGGPVRKGGRHGISFKTAAEDL